MVGVNGTPTRQYLMSGEVVWKWNWEMAGKRGVILEGGGMGKIGDWASEGLAGGFWVVRT